ncbi:uncharacterized protein LOC106669091 [Cimex lectularius]|uniref:Uncharacterized protein n=1 Tax=Cimex lectularius TaxID=79782 RepID=A0A8I6RWS1_CIMLE|nr:uncharacterized protein LOC106669091 [Cimex lectularius]
MMLSGRNIFLAAFGLIAVSISAYAVWSVWNGNNLTILEMRTEFAKEKDRYKTFNGLSTLSIARMNEVKMDIAYGLGVNKEAALKRIDKLNEDFPDDYALCPNKPNHSTVTVMISEIQNFYDEIYRVNALNITSLLAEYAKDLKRGEEEFESMAGDCKPNIFYFNCILQLNDLFREEIDGLVASRDNISEIIHNLNDLLKTALETSLGSSLGLLDKIRDVIKRYVCCLKNLKIFLDTHEPDCDEPGLTTDY